MLRWQSGSWLIEDLGSTNGTYVDHNYERKTQVALMHGGEVQLGELPPQARELRARLAAAQARAAVPRASATASPGSSSREHLMKAIDEDGVFGDWAEAPMQVARYELRGPNRHVSERPTILEMLALRRAAQRVVELTEMLLLRLTPVVAGRTGPLKFVVSMVGPDARRGAPRRRAGRLAGAGHAARNARARRDPRQGRAGRPGRTLID